MGWRAVGVSVEGAAHRQRGGGCQDAHAIGETPHGLVLAAADGAGSARFGGLGARLAVEAVTGHLAGATAAAPATVAAAIGIARSTLEQAAAADGHAIGDLATTLHIAWLCGDRVLTGQIGDGAVVVRHGGALRSLDPAPRSEYLNETVFLTSRGWVDDVRIGLHDAADADGVAVLTDGLQLLAFELATDTPHPGFFGPLWRWAADLDASQLDGEGQDELATFLGSGRVRARTDDDTTLVLAVRA